MVFQKGHKFGKGRPKGSKNETTLLEEERRARFNMKASERWDKVIDALISKNPTYVADQFMGKAPDKATVEIIEKPYDELPKNNGISKDKGNIEED